MPQDGYELDITLAGHTGTITTLQFSPDYKFLASGSDHGMLLVFSTSSWRPLKQLIDASSITTIVWHDTEHYLLLCGCESGDLHFLHLTKSLVCPPPRGLTQVVIASRKSSSIRVHTLKDRSARYRSHQPLLPLPLAMEETFPLEK
jgi:WD40 repeat protein